MRNIVRISDIAKLPLDKQPPYKPSTLYKWWHLNKYAELFIKFGGGLFIDLDALERVIEKSRGKQA
jgi:hypothetical protein